MPISYVKMYKKCFILAKYLFHFITSILNQTSCGDSDKTVNRFLFKLFMICFFFNLHNNQFTYSLKIYRL